MIKGTKNGKSTQIAVRWPLHLVTAAERRSVESGMTVAKALVEAAEIGFGIRATNAIAGDVVSSPKVVAAFKGKPPTSARSLLGNPVRDDPVPRNVTGDVGWSGLKPTGKAKS